MSLTDMNKHLGSCLCGQIAFEIHGDFDAFFFCHCSRCRKVTGTVHGANLFSKTAKLVWLSGDDQVRKYNVPGSRFTKSFCSTCSAALPSLDAGRLLVPAGSLDSDPGITPTAHIFIGSKAPWEHDLDKVAQFDERPS